MIQLPRPKYAEPARMVDFFARAIEGLSTEPGVESVALTSFAPVGVVGTVKHYGLRDGDAVQMYEPFAQMPKSSMTMIVKTTNDPASVFSAVRRQIQKADPAQPVSAIGSVEQTVAATGAVSRTLALLMAALGAVALALAAVGLYGVIAYSVSHRTQEFGIRMALGARHSSILAMVMRQAVALILCGLSIGLAAALLAGRLLRHAVEPLLFRVTIGDASTFLMVGMLLASVAVVAAVIAARQAMRVDPIRALRAYPG